MAAPLRIFLDPLPYPVVIVPAPTGVIYACQVGGTACLQREVEGYLVPLGALAHRIFSPAWWQHEYPRRTPGDDAAWRDACEVLDAALRGYDGGSDGPAALRAAVETDDVEAWVHVTLELPELDAQLVRHGTVALRGILTWENSD